MQVTEVMSFNSYWSDSRFQQKTPNLRGSKKQAFGDNIYYRNMDTREWHQLDSHHSHPDGTPNIRNVNNDTKTDSVLVSDCYIYWGGKGPEIPARFRNFDGFDLCKVGMGHKCKFPDNMVTDFIDWILSLGVQGYCGTPLDWSNTS